MATGTISSTETKTQWPLSVRLIHSLSLIPHMETHTLTKVIKIYTPGAAPDVHHCSVRRSSHIKVESSLGRKALLSFIVISSHQTVRCETELGCGAVTELGCGAVAAALWMQNSHPVLGTQGSYTLTEYKGHAAQSAVLDLIKLPNKSQSL